MAEPRFQRDVFIALAAVAWADGTLDPEEADAIVRAAVDAELDLDAISEIEKATAAPVDLATIERSAMTKGDRLFVYAVARWIAELDGEVTEKEQLLLATIGERLGVPERTRASVESIVREVARMPEGDRPYRYDLAALRRRIDERLAAPATAAP